MMIGVALNVGPLFFISVPSLNDDVCGPFALKKNTNHSCVCCFFSNDLFFLSFNKSRHVKNAFKHGKYEIYVCCFKKHTTSEQELLN